MIINQELIIAQGTEMTQNSIIVIRNISLVRSPEMLGLNKKRIVYYKRFIYNIRGNFKAKFREK